MDPSQKMVTIGEQYPLLASLFSASPSRAFLLPNCGGQPWVACAPLCRE